MKTKKEIEKEFETLETEKQQMQKRLNEISIRQVKLQGQFELLDEEEKKSLIKTAKKA